MQNFKIQLRPVGPTYFIIRPLDNRIFQIFSSINTILQQQLNSRQRGTSLIEEAVKKGWTIIVVDKLTYDDRIHNLQATILTDKNIGLSTDVLYKYNIFFNLLKLIDAESNEVLRIRLRVLSFGKRRDDYSKTFYNINYFRLYLDNAHNQQ